MKNLIMNIIRPEELKSIDRYDAISFLNQISGVRTPFLLGSKNQNGIENLAIFNSVIHIGANPPLLGLIMRPVTVERHSYQNIIDNNVYTLNLVSKSFMEKAHQTAAKYNADQSEFKMVGLTPSYIEGFKAPFVEDSPLKMGLIFKELKHINSNETLLIIGEVQFIATKDKIQDYKLNFEDLDAISVNGLYDYYSLTYQSKRGFPKPE